MVGQHREFEVRLHRDGPSTSWGFRLQGGYECQAPLTIQRVFVGSPSDGQLHRGDVVSSIEQYDASHMHHKQAEDLIRAARNNLTLTVRRGESPGHMDNYGSSMPYHQPSGSWPPSNEPADEDEYTPRSVKEMRQKFSAPQPSGSVQARGGDYDPSVIQMHPQPGQPSYIPKRPVWKKQETSAAGLADPGWVPGQQRRAPPPARQYTSTRARSPPVNRPGRAPHRLSPPRPSAEQHHEPPAWAGSLRHSGGPRRWEMEEAQQLMGGGARTARPVSPQRVVSHPPAVQSAPHAEPFSPHSPRVQSVRYGPGPGGPVYEQHGPGTPSDSARVAHLQYNSPIGLYSRQNAQDALQVQTVGKPGYGTMQITGGGGGVKKSFDPAHSDVLRMVAEEDAKHARPGQHHGPVHSAPHQRQHAAHHDAAHQHHHGHHGGMSHGNDTGISDF